MTKVAAVILAHDAGDLVRQARAALSEGADLAELRLDSLAALDDATVARLATSIGARSIATVRSPDQGGVRGLDAARREALLREIFARRFAFVDLELGADDGRAEELVGLAERPRRTVIASFHFAHPTDASKVQDAVEACAALGDVAKVAVPVTDSEAAVQLVDLARTQAKRKRRLVLIGMGVAGMITRALADEVGQEIQFAAWGRAAAPGQLSLGTAKRLRGRTPIVLGLVGNPLGHSISPAIHEAALDALALPAVYLPFEVRPESIGGLLHAADRLRIRGFNVTIPYKESIAEELDELDGDAERLGAVNTVVIGDGWSKGYNTDVFGFRFSLRSLRLRVGERTALVIGAGGAAKAVVHVLLREGAKVQVANRSIERAEAIADAVEESVEVVPIDTLPHRGPWDLLVNATPIGTRGLPGGLPVPEAVVAKAGFVYDVVYNPPTTPLLAEATRLGKPHTSGLEMLLHQAAKSFELWVGRPPPIDAMRRAAKEALG